MNLQRNSNGMSHIAIDARIINSSTGTYVERLLTYLQQIDTANQYSVIVPTRDKDYWKPTANNFKVITADFANYSLSEQIGFKIFLDKLSPDLVHFCMPQQPILYRGAHVTTFHDLTLLRTYNSDKNWLIFHIKQTIGKFVFKSVAKSSKHIITPTEFTKNELVKFAHIQPDKITVTYEAADTFVDQSAAYKSPFKQYLLYVGQQSDYKNIRRLGDAHQQLLNKYPDLGLVLVGKINKSASANKKYFEDKKYKNIHFAGFIPNNQLSSIYSKAAAYVFPSLMEGFGLPGLEAMAYKTPVISSNATCLPEVYGQAAVYFNPNNTGDIAKSIDRVLSDKGLQKYLIEKGTLQLRKYSWKKMARETYNVYLDVINS